MDAVALVAFGQEIFRKIPVPWLGTGSQGISAGVPDGPGHLPGGIAPKPVRHAGFRDASADGEIPGHAAHVRLIIFPPPFQKAFPQPFRKLGVIFLQKPNIAAILCIGRHGVQTLSFPEFVQRIVQVIVGGKFLFRGQLAGILNDRAVTGFRYIGQKFPVEHKGVDHQVGLGKKRVFQPLPAVFPVDDPPFRTGQALEGILSRAVRQKTYVLFSFHLLAHVGNQVRGVNPAGIRQRFYQDFPGLPLDQLLPVQECQGVEPKAFRGVHSLFQLFPTVAGVNRSGIPPQIQVSRIFAVNPQGVPIRLVKVPGLIQINFPVLAGQDRSASLAAREPPGHPAGRVV